MLGLTKFQGTSHPSLTQFWLSHWQNLIKQIMLVTQHGSYAILLHLGRRHGDESSSVEALAVSCISEYCLSILAEDTCVLWATQLFSCWLTLNPCAWPLAYCRPVERLQGLTVLKVNVAAPTAELMKDRRSVGALAVVVWSLWPIALGRKPWILTVMFWVLWLKWNSSPRW